MDEQRIVQVRLENISRSFVSRKTIFEAVNHVSIDVYKNEFLVLLGPGQCGKTVGRPAWIRECASEAAFRRNETASGNCESLLQ